MQRKIPSIPSGCAAGAVPRRCRGLTLIELLITLSVVALLMALASGDFSRLGAADRAQAALDSLRSALELARVEAVRRGESVVLCRRAAETSRCQASTSSGQLSWAGGWLAFVDVDQDRAYRPEAGDILLRQGEAVAEGQRLKWNQGDYLGFSPVGGLDSRSGTFCLDWQALGDAGRVELKIPYTGRIQQTRGECSYTL